MADGCVGPPISSRKFIKGVHIGSGVYLPGSLSKACLIQDCLSRALIQTEHNCYCALEELQREKSWWHKEKWPECGGQLKMLSNYYIECAIPPLGYIRMAISWKRKELPEMRGASSGATQRTLSENIRFTCRAHPHLQTFHSFFVSAVQR